MPALPSPSPSQLAEMYSQVIAWVRARGGARHGELESYLSAKWGHIYRPEGRREPNRLHQLIFSLRAFDIWTAELDGTIVDESLGRRGTANFYVAPNSDPIAPPGFRVWRDDRHLRGCEF